jgi:putative transposase
MKDNFKFHRPADQKAAAVSEVVALVKAGKGVRDAVEDVAYRTGFGERTLYTLLKKTKGIPSGDWETVLARKRPEPRPRKICPPAALARFIELCRSGRYVTDCYRLLLSEAAEKGWNPIPSERTMRRELDRHYSPSVRWLQGREPNNAGEV